MIHMRNDNILVRLDSFREDRVTEGGIVLPRIQEQNEKILQGIAVSVGPRCREIHQDDRVLIDHDAGDRYTMLEGQTEDTEHEFRIVREAEIHCTV